MSCPMDFTHVDRKQLQGVVSERNEYRRLLSKCLQALNEIPNTKLCTPSVKSTYRLASQIESAFKRFDS